MELLELMGMGSLQKSMDIFYKVKILLQELNINIVVTTDKQR